MNNHGVVIVTACIFQLIRHLIKCSHVVSINQNLYLQLVFLFALVTGSRLRIAWPDVEINVKTILLIIT